MKKKTLDKGVAIMKSLISIDSELTPEMAAGIAGNLFVESSFNHEIVNEIGHRGLAQWDPNIRWPKYKRWLNTQKRTDSVESQLNWIFVEPSEDSRNAVSNLKSFKDISASLAAQSFHDDYERTMLSNDDRRVVRRLESAELLVDHYYDSVRGTNFKEKKAIRSSVWRENMSNGSVEMGQDEIFRDSFRIQGKRLIDVDPSYKKEKKDNDRPSFDGSGKYFSRKL